MKEEMDLGVVPYGCHNGSSKIDSKFCGNGDQAKEKPVEKTRRFVVEPVTTLTTDGMIAGKMVRYRECMRNHAASIGGHTNDGCGEFMPGGEEGTREVLSCAACGCHRNFHRKEMPGGGGIGGCVDNHLLHPPPPPTPIVLYNAEKNNIGGFLSLSAVPLRHPQPHHRNSGGIFGVVDVRNLNDRKDDRRSETPEERGEVNVGRSKRFRTKFTQEQKEKMMEFAERMGWRIQKQDDVALNQFCLDIGVKRSVLKVWMHNNKSTLRKKENAATPAPAAAPPPSIGAV